MLCKQKLSARRQRVRDFSLRLILILILLSVFLEFAVKSQLTDVISMRMKALAQRAVNDAVADYLAENPGIGESLSNVRYAENGAVTSVTSDPAAVNRLKASVSALAQDYIDDLSNEEGLHIPLGSFSGFVPLANLGPEVRLDIGSRQAVVCSLHSSFESGGVNQTLHHIYLTVEVEIVVYNPFRISKTIRTAADFEIAQTVIVGAVPNYTYGSLWQ